jgi:hypothetical protein
MEEGMAGSLYTLSQSCCWPPFLCRCHGDSAVDVLLASALDPHHPPEHGRIATEDKDRPFSQRFSFVCAFVSGVVKQTGMPGC